MRNAIRYFQFVRHLRPVQFYARVRKLLRPPRVGHVSTSPVWRSPPGHWVKPAVMPHTLLPDNRFLILGEEKTLNPREAWNYRERGRKWLMELHTFHLLSTASPDLGSELIRIWIQNIPPGQGPGWHPYITSHRIANWLKWGLAGNSLDAESLKSLVEQIRYLMQAINYDELDHKLLNFGRSLLLAGVCLETVDSSRWRTRGQALVKKYSQQLVGRDGGYEGLSPMYHSALLTDLLDVFNIQQAYQMSDKLELQNVIASARAWLAAMCHPDGQISLFNDAVLDVVAEPAEIEKYAWQLSLAPLPSTPSGLVSLPESGFMRMALGPAVAIVDVGAIGPDHNPTHGHADTLTFELSLQGRRLVVDSGTSTYETMPQRLMERETAAHNTLVLDHRNSSDVWSRFKVGRRAIVQEVTTDEQPDTLQVSAVHNGFRLLGNRLLHRREWEMTPETLIIRDQVTGRGHHQAEVACHFHPDIQVEIQENGSALLRFEEGEPVATLEWDSPSNVRLEPYSYHPRFNVSQSAWKLVACLSGTLPLELRCKFTWL